MYKVRTRQLQGTDEGKVFIVNVTEDSQKYLEEPRAGREISRPKSTMGGKRGRKTERERERSEREIAKRAHG